MRKMLIGVFMLAFGVVGVSACGSNDTRKTDGKAPAVQTTAGLAQKASATATTVVGKEAAGAEGLKSDAAGDAGKGVRYTLVLGEGKGGFRVNSFALSEDAKAKIDEMFTGGKVDLKNAHFEIEGHTDNLGSKDVNERVGLARAEAVRLYLSERYEVPMDCIAVVSYGFEKPIADNATEEGRAMNRRVVIKVVD